MTFSSEECQVTVGCELTNYYAGSEKRGSPQARFQRQWKKFSKSLRERLDNEGEMYRYLYGAIHFHAAGFALFDGIDSNALTAEIIAAVKKVDSVQFPLANFNFNESPILATHVHHIYLKNTAPETGILWWPAHLQSGRITDPRDRLIEITKGKNAKAKTYDWKSASEKWLLIYSESEGISDMVGLYTDPEIRANLGQLVFDRVYVWNKFLESIDEIYPNFITLFKADSNTLHRKIYPLLVRPFIFGPI